MFFFLLKSEYLVWWRLESNEGVRHCRWCCPIAPGVFEWSEPSFSRFLFFFFAGFQNGVYLLHLVFIFVLWNLVRAMHDSHIPKLNQVEQVGIAAAKPEYKPGVFDDMFLNLFRNKLVQVKKTLWSPLLMWCLIYSSITGGRVGLKGTWIWWTNWSCASSNDEGHFQFYYRGSSGISISLNYPFSEMFLYAISFFLNCLPLRTRIVLVFGSFKMRKCVTNRLPINLIKHVE